MSSLRREVLPGDPEFLVLLAFIVGFTVVALAGGFLQRRVDPDLYIPWDRPADFLCDPFEHRGVALHSWEIP